MTDMTEEAVARAVMNGMNWPETPDTPCSKMMPNGEWKVVGPLWEVEFLAAAKAAIATLQSLGWLPPDRAKAMRNEVREADAKAMSEMVFSSTRRAGDLIQDQCAVAIRAMKET